MQIGIKIKEIRLKKQLTQEELADRCELTKGYISQIENDLTSPTLATLKDILQALGTTLSDFFADDEQEQVVFTKDDYFEKQSDASVITWLVPTSQKNAMEPIMLTLEPHASTDKDLPHDGEEFGFGAEIGISTGKLHARGPMGLNELTCTKYVIKGNGQTRG